MVKPNLKRSKVGEVTASPVFETHHPRTQKPMPLPPEFSKPIQYECNGRKHKFKGRRAYLSDLLIKEKLAGVDRSQTWPWCANLGDTISALRKKGLDIPRPVGGSYVLLSDVRRIGDAK